MEMTATKTLQNAIADEIITLIISANTDLTSNNVKRTRHNFHAYKLWVELENPDINISPDGIGGYEKIELIYKINVFYMDDGRMDTIDKLCMEYALDIFDVLRENPEIGSGDAAVVQADVLSIRSNVFSGIAKTNVQIQLRCELSL